MSDLSIVIPTHKRRKDLLRLLSSIEESLRLSDLQLQVIVVDSSNQASLSQNEILSFGRNPQLKLEYVRSTKSGVNGKRNQGLMRATAPFTLFLDDDCEVSSPDLFTYHLHLHRESTAILVGGNYHNFPHTPSARAYCRIYADWKSFDEGLELAPFVGGNLSLKTDLHSPWLRFDEGLKFGGTEKELILRMLSLGHTVKYSQLLTVDHHVTMSLKSLIKKALYQGLGESLMWKRYSVFLQKENELYNPQKKHSSWLEAFYSFFFHVGYVHGQLGSKSEIVFSTLLKAFYHRLFFNGLPPSVSLPDEKKMPPSVASLLEMRVKSKLDQLYGATIDRAWHGFRMLYGHYLLPLGIRLLKPYFFTRYQVQTRLIPLLKQRRKD